MPVPGFRVASPVAGVSPVSCGWRAGLIGVCGAVVVCSESDIYLYYIEEGISHLSCLRVGNYPC